MSGTRGEGQELANRGGRSEVERLKDKIEAALQPPVAPLSVPAENCSESPDELVPADAPSAPAAQSRTRLPTAGALTACDAGQSSSSYFSPSSISSSQQPRKPWQIRAVLARRVAGRQRGIDRGEQAFFTGEVDYRVFSNTSQEREIRRLNKEFFGNEEFRPHQKEVRGGSFLLPPLQIPESLLSRSSTALSNTRIVSS